MAKGAAIVAAMAATAVLVGWWWALLTATVQGDTSFGVDVEDRASDESCPLPLPIAAQKSLLHEITFQVHYNGNPEPCGTVLPGGLPLQMEKMLHAMEACHVDSTPTSSSSSLDETTPTQDKYWFETFLTNAFHFQFMQQPGGGGTVCASYDDQEYAESGFFDFCDLGEDRTPPQPDRDSLVLTLDETLPCRFYTREGVRIASLTQLVELAQHEKELRQLEACGAEPQQGEETCAAATPLDLYAVPAGRVFMFAPKFVGEIFQLDHVQDASGSPLSMKVLSLNPRVFDIFNFFSVDESQELIDKALRETSSTHGLHRSTTGATGGSVFSKRTSENAWDTHGRLAILIKKRCMSVLGFDEYYESHTDGLQILRYNQTKAYVPHMDYLDNFDSDPYDYDSSRRGGNRFATILLYMSNLTDDDGGETVFSEAPPMGSTEMKSTGDVIRDLRQSGNVLDLFSPGSWEEDMTAKCRSRLAVKPHKSRAVLFYSQFPNGEQDPASKHGGCPVLTGTKWAANLWAWNAARAEFDHSPYKPGRKRKSEFSQVKATFRNSGNDPSFNDAELYYDENGFFGKLGPHEDVRVNTYRTHKWNIKSSSSGEILKTIIIEDDTEEEQLFVI